MSKLFIAVHEQYKLAEEKRLKGYYAILEKIKENAEHGSVVIPFSEIEIEQKTVEKLMIEGFNVYASGARMASNRLNQKAIDGADQITVEWIRRPS